MKLVTKEKSTIKELYNLDQDIGEENNLADFFPKEVQRLDSILQAWDNQLIDPIFLGLIHTERWRKRLNQKPQK